MRIVVYGPPLAGKRTILQILAQSRGLSMQAFAAPTLEGQTETGNRIVWLERSVQFELMTFPGCLWDERVWESPIASADVIMLVLDPQMTRADVDRDYVERINESVQPQRRGCVVVTKDDLTDAGVETIDIRQLTHHSICARWPIFRTRMDRPETLLAAINWLTRQNEENPPR